LKREVFRDEAGFQTLRPFWNNLLQRSRSNTLFLTWEWQTTWWRCLGNGELCLIAWQHENDLIGIGPLFLEIDDKGVRRLSLVGCIEVSDYLDLIVATGYEESVFADFVDWLTRGEDLDWDEVQLCNVPQDSLSHQLLPQLAAQQGLNSATQVEDVCPVIDLPTTWDAYLMERLSKKQRHEVRRKARRAHNEASVHWYIVNDTDNLGLETDAFIQLHRLSTQEKHSFMTPEMQAFFQEIAQVMIDIGWLQLAFIELDGQKAAGMLSFAYNDRVLVYNSGYDPDRYSELSPGIVLTSYVIQAAIEQGYRYFDFLQGSEVYKYRFGATDTIVYDTRIWPEASTR
jgi:CelD/BcsL family acetyltransferase involved in cellulose biosynthesis